MLVQTGQKYQRYNTYFNQETRPTEANMITTIKVDVLIYEVQVHSPSINNQSIDNLYLNTVSLH